MRGFSRWRLALAALAVGLFLSACGDDQNNAAAPDGAVTVSYPKGAQLPERRITDLEQAAAAAGCELAEPKVSGRDHLEGTLRYPTRPPAGGDHLAIPAEDGIYDTAPAKEALVHSLEHGRVVVWFKPELSDKVLGQLMAFFDTDRTQLIMTPDSSGMTYAVAATAWNREPEPLGAGRLLGCPKASDRIFDALAAFRDENRGRGPEAIP